MGNSTVPGTKVSEGLRMLWRVLREKRWSQGRLAKEVGTTSANVNRWLLARRKPDRAYAARIEHAVGVQTALWDQLPRAPISFAQHVSTVTARNRVARGTSVPQRAATRTKRAGERGAA